MKHRIDPKVDCVFKALLGTEENRNLLIHFINAILADELESPIVEVKILDPHNGKEFLDDKLSIVDVKAQSCDGRVFQIEIQILNYHHLPARMIYGWADLYSQQLQSGQDYHLLKPVYSIWLLAEDLIKDDATYAHTYKLRDGLGRIPIQHGGIWVFELGKFMAERIETDQQRWLKFFKEGGQLDDAALPAWMNTTEMRQAMETLRRFSEKDLDYFRYQARQNYLREQRTLQWEREQAERAREQAEREREQAEREREQAERALEREHAEKQEALQREQAALAEIQRLRARLAQQEGHDE